MDLEGSLEHFSWVIWLSTFVIDEDLQLHLVLDTKDLPQLLHHLLPVLVTAEGGSGSAEGRLGQVSLCQAP